MISTISRNLAQSSAIGDDDFMASFKESFGTSKTNIADAMFAPVVLRLRTYGINLPESAGFYPQRLLESEAMQEWLLAAEAETEVIDREETGQ